MPVLLDHGNRSLGCNPMRWIRYHLEIIGLIIICAVATVTAHSVTPYIVQILESKGLVLYYVLSLGESDGPVADPLVPMTVLFVNCCICLIVAFISTMVCRFRADVSYFFVCLTISLILEFKVGY